MTLTSNDYQKIANEIQIGKDMFEYEKDGETLVVDYEYEVDGYREDDYDGTGAFVVTSRSLSINSESYSADGDITENNFDYNEVLKRVA